MIKKFKNTVLWTHVIGGVNGKEIIGMVNKKELQKTNQQSLELKK